MKYLIIFGLVLLGACVAQKVQKPKNETIRQLLQSGKDILIEGQTFENDLDFIKMLSQNPVNQSISQIKTTAAITFKNCVFKGKVAAFEQVASGHVVRASFLSNVSFVNCEFQEEVTFRGAQILGIVDFSQSKFFAKANFEEAQFHSNVYFRGCNFYDESHFQNAFFHQKANFLEAAFDKTAYFQNTTFQGETQFDVAKFQGYADFSLLHCQQNCFFNYTWFNDQSNFNQAYFAKGADFNNVRFEHGEFRNAAFLGKTRFYESSATLQMDFENSFFQFGKPDLDSFESDKISLMNIKE